MASWKGKAIGAGLGWFFLGPLGAIVGAVIGHGFDEKANAQQRDEYVRRVRGQAGPRRPYQQYQGGQRAYRPVRDLSHEARRKDLSSDERQLIFVTNLASLLVSVAIADGVYRPEERRSILGFFKRNGFVGEDLNLIARITDEVAKQKPDLAAICEEYHQVSSHQDRLLLLRALYVVAMSDREFHPAEQRVIETITKHFGISVAEARSIRSEFISEKDQHYQVLGISANASVTEIKKAYREQAGKYHPDRVSHLGEEFVKMAHDRFQAINEAYQAIRKERGF